MSRSTARTGSVGVKTRARPAAVPLADIAAANRRAPRARATKQGIAAVWDKFHKAIASNAEQSVRDGLRNQLIENYCQIVRYTAERMRQKLPSEVDVDDLMSAGLFGLMDAIDAFDPKRGVKFETYCTQRISGAIVDELRAMDWVPRLVRSRTAKVERARKQLEMEKGRKVSDAEVCEVLQMSAEEFDKVVKDSRPVGTVSLNRKWFEGDSSREVREIDVISDVRQSDPVHEAQRGDLQMLLTKGLSRAERLILILYYYEEMTMKEIGLTLDLSESRVSQMHSSILARLKAQMQHRLKEVEEE